MQRFRQRLGRDPEYLRDQGVALRLDNGAGGANRRIGLGGFGVGGQREEDEEQRWERARSGPLRPPAAGEPSTFSADDTPG
jgi:hypothetical protein